MLPLYLFKLFYIDMKLNAYFRMEEFVPPLIYNKILKSKNPLATFYTYVNPQIISIATFTRELFGKPLIVNNWHTGGTYTLRGYRPSNTKIGAKFSMHKLGKAFDFDVVGLPDSDVKAFIMKNQESFYKAGVRRMESALDAPTWTHLDIKEVEGYENKLYIFRA